MLDILEFNSHLYDALDKQRKKKNIISGTEVSFLSHAESHIDLQAATWLANYKGITASDRFNKTPQGMKEICEGLIPECSKLLRKANRNGGSDETKKDLRNARKFLEDCLAECNKALGHSDEDSEHLEHKRRGGRYIDITPSGRYIYPEDLKKKGNIEKAKAEGEAKAKWEQERAKQAAADKQYNKGFMDSVTEYSNNAIKAAKQRINAATDPDDEWLQKQANNSGDKEIREPAKKKIEELRAAQKNNPDLQKKKANEAKGQAEGEAKAQWEKDKKLEEEYQKSVDNWRKNRDAAKGAGERRALKMKANALKHSADDGIYPEDYKGLKADEFYGLLEHSAFQSAMVTQTT